MADHDPKVDPTSSAADGRRLDPVAVVAARRRLLARSTHAPWLHGEVARRMAEKLQVILLRPGLVIDWWSAAGAGEPLLREAYPDAERVLVEPDTAWADRSRSLVRSPWWSARRWSGTAPKVVTEAEGVPGGAGLVWANMMLHMVVDPSALIRRWQQLLRIDGFVMFSCPGPGTLRELRTLYARLGWPAPTPGFVDMHDLGDMLVQAGFADPVMDQETLRLTWASPQALLAELRLLGGNTAPDRVAGLRTPRWRAALESELGVLADADGRIGMSFEIAYGHAVKGSPRMRVGEAATLSADDLRTMARSGQSRLRKPGSLS